MLISWSASGNGPVKDEEGASDMEEATSINDEEASVLPEDSASNVGDDVAVPREEPTDEADFVHHGMRHFGETTYWGTKAAIQIGLRGAPREPPRVHL